MFASMSLTYVSRTEISRFCKVVFSHKKGHWLYGDTDKWREVIRGNETVDAGPTSLELRPHIDENRLTMDKPESG